jgi:hypothetical protein
MQNRPTLSLPGGPLLERNGRAEAVVTCPLLGEERKSLPTFKMTAFDGFLGSNGFGRYPVSAVSIVFALQRKLSPRDTALYIAAQVVGGIVGTMIAHGMFAMPLLERLDREPLITRKLNNAQ